MLPAEYHTRRLKGTWLARGRQVQTFIKFYNIIVIVTEWTALNVYIVKMLKKKKKLLTYPVSCSRSIIFVVLPSLSDKYFIMWCRLIGRSEKLKIQVNRPGRLKELVFFLVFISFSFGNISWISVNHMMKLCSFTRIT